MSESRESNPESQSPRTAAACRSAPGDFARRGPHRPCCPHDQHGGEATASVHNDDELLDTECEVITVGHARFYLRRLATTAG